MGGWRGLLLEGEESRERLVRGSLIFGIIFWGALRWETGLDWGRGIAEEGVSLGPGTVLSPSRTEACDDVFIESSLEIDSSSSSSESSLSAGLWVCLSLSWMVVMMEVFWVLSIVGICSCLEAGVGDGGSSG